jgi:hypothetical protein
MPRRDPRPAPVGSRRFLRRAFVGPQIRGMKTLLVTSLFAITLLAAPRAHAQDCITIENFASAKVGEFPAGWKVRKDEAESAYRVTEEGGTRFLRTDAEKIGQQAAKQFEWNLDEYPILAWRWRPIEFPKDSDERTKKNDSVLAVYLLVPYSKVRGPQAVKYVWSEKVPVGTQLESNMGLTKVRVLKSGVDGKGNWSEERVDARAHFLAAFGVDKAPAPGGIAVLTDADDTESRAIGDYADFRACRK